jgi:chromosome segregation ATPase
METILAFVWGMITVVYTLMAVVVVQMRKSVKQLESQIRDTNETLQDVYKQLEEKEGKSVDYTDSLHSKHEEDLNELYRYVDSRFEDLNELYRYVDSRFDKFENRIQSEKGEQIQRLKTQFDEFVKSYQNQ